MNTAAQQLANSVAGLVTPPLVALRLSRMLENPDVSAQDVAQIVESDPNLVIAILRLANSAYYSRGRRIDTVEKAIIRLGSGLVREIALGVCVARAFTGLPQRRQVSERFWRHSVNTAIACRFLAAQSEIEHHDAAYTAGLLHDIGELVIYSKGVDAGELRERYEQGPKVALYRLEREELGFDHAQVGEALAAQWQLPEILQECMRAHHEPERYRFCPRLVYAVHVADIVAIAVENGDEAFASTPPISTQAWPALNVDRDILPDVVREVREQSEDMLTIFQGAALAA